MPFRKCTLVPSWFWDTDVLNYVWTSASPADEVVRESWWNPGMILVEIVHESCEVVQPSAEIGWTCAHPILETDACEEFFVLPFILFGVFVPLLVAHRTIARFNSSLIRRITGWPIFRASVAYFNFAGVFAVRANR